MLNGIIVFLGIFIIGLAGGALGWYPSRVGGPAYWLDDHIYAPVVSGLTNGPGWPANAGFLYAVGLAVAFGGYLLAAQQASRRREGSVRHLAIVVAIQLAICAWLIVQPYLSSQDIFSYAFYSHILVWYHANPYTAVPRDFPFDPLFGAIFWKDQPSNYGPIWTYLGAIVTMAVGTGTGVTIATLRGAAAVATIAGTPLVWAIAGRVRQDRRLMAAILWGWNPLLLVDSASAGHNDVLMALFVIVSMWFWFRERRTLGIGFLVLAVLTKYVAAILLPLYLLAWIRREPRRRVAILVKAGLLGGLLTVAGFAPVYAGPSTLGVLGFGSNPLAYINSPLELAFRDLRVALGESPDLVNLPLHYLGYWVGATSPAVLWEGPDTTHTTGIALPREEPLLVVESPSGEWLHVYVSRIGRFGFVHANEVRAIPAPRPPPADPSTVTVFEGPGQDPYALQSNFVLRLLAGLVFLVAYARQLIRVQDGIALVHSSLLILIVFLLVVQSWFWPWYLIWALPFAVLTTNTIGGRSLLALTATASILNVAPAVAIPPTLNWLLQARMLAIDGVPFIGVALMYLGSRDGAQLRAILQRSKDVVANWADFPPRLGRSPFCPTVIIGLLTIGGFVLWRSAPTSPAGAFVDPGKQAYAQAQQFYGAGNYEGAAFEASVVLRTDPNEASALQLRISSNLAMHRYAETIPDLTRLLDKDPGNVELLLERADMYDRIQRDDKARDDYFEVVRINPRDPSGYFGLGVVEFQRGNLPLSEKWLTSALVADPGRFETLRQLGDVNAASGRPLVALTRYNQAVRIDPLDVKTYAARAAVLSQRGQSPTVTSDLQQVLILSGDVEEHHWAARHLDSSAKSTGADQNSPE